MADGPKVPLGNKKDKTNWLERAGGLPTFMKGIAEHLKGKNPSWDDGRCIAVAVNSCKRWCSSGTVTEGGKGNGGKGVTAKTKAKACAAVASWEAKKAKSKTNLSAHPSGKERLVSFDGTFILESDADLILSIHGEVESAEGEFDASIYELHLSRARDAA